MTEENVEHMLNSFVVTDQPHNVTHIQEILKIEHLEINHRFDLKNTLSLEKMQSKKEINYDLTYLWKPIESRIRPKLCKGMYITIFDREGYVVDPSHEAFCFRCGASDYLNPFLSKGLPVEISFKDQLIADKQLYEVNSKSFNMDKTGHESYVFPIFDRDKDTIGYIGAGNLYGSVPAEISLLGYLGSTMLQYKYLRLLEHRQTIDSLLNGLPTCAFLVDENSMVTGANRQFMDLLGYSFEYSPSLIPLIRILKNNEIEDILKTGETSFNKSLNLITAENKCIQCNIINKQIVKFTNFGSQLLVLVDRIIKSISKNNGQSYSFDHFIGESSGIKSVKTLGKMAATKPSNILIEGESGTGKEVLAEAIHLESGRMGPFIPINCGSFAKELLRSELFGYEEGTFTGAKKGGHIGLFEKADGGTIFLDEIGEMPLDMQVSLLRFLEDRIVIRIGGHKRKKVNVKIIAATNRSLQNEVCIGNFREDLYYRLNVVSIFIPPLRERKEDLPLLMQNILKKLCLEFDINQPEVTQPVMDLLLEYSWPGNVRELKNVLECSLITCQNNMINTNNLPAYFLRNVSRLNTQVYEKINRTTVINALKECHGNISKATKSLGLSRPTLYRKLKEYDINLTLYKKQNL
ncbi:MAG: sigma 54-interacting transcriptional regulator [Dehalobacterium sp.]